MTKSQKKRASRRPVRVARGPEPQEASASVESPSARSRDLAAPVDGAPLPPVGEPLAVTAAQAFSSADGIYAFSDCLAEQHQADVASAEAKRQLETWVAFRIAGELYGLPVTVAQEILRVESITRVPHAPSTIRGIINMRGRVLPVVDVRLRLGLAAAQIALQSRILVVSARSRLLGLLVDSVEQVLRLDRNGVEAPPPDVMTEQSEYISGVYHLEDGLLILLEVGQLLQLPDGPAEALGG
jgi:purine-binding chemotaxis protein CheW